ncbi:hypothetical protein OsJ_03418 [Oryza sativa Japonica Group]|uniref:Histidine-containing phosphotransfer protein n=1 Tax=Oryza sativa subsp. japonica TaxID=39947 RepID=B9EZM2_ORYSJ|nr:hypothetical protein OsJ_03418 [Oryza sativa Japonica Group]
MLEVSTSDPIFSILLLFHGYLDEQFCQVEDLQDEASPNFVEEVVTLFFKDSGRLMSNIEQALEKYPRDFNRWDTYMQQLKGSCSSIGASRMKNECMSFRDSCGQGNVEGCMRSFQKVKREHAVLRQKLESYFQLLRQAGPAGAATRPVIMLKLFPDLQSIQILGSKWIFQSIYRSFAQLCSCTWAEEQKGILADDRLAKKPSRQYSMEKGSATNRAIPDFRSAAAMSDAMRRARRRSPCHARNTRNGTRRAGARPDPEPSRQPIRVLGGRSLSVDETWVTSPAAAVFLRHGETRAPAFALGTAGRRRGEDDMSVIR